MTDHHVVAWALAVIVLLLTLKMIEGYIIRPHPLIDITQPLNVQDTITGKNSSEIQFTNAEFKFYK